MKEHGPVECEGLATQRALVILSPPLDGEGLGLHQSPAAAKSLDLPAVLTSGAASTGAAVQDHGF
jgi:hypothetical protein